ncbi:enoyl-CoA hydratase/isomerase family protein [Saccharopolyspora spinosa]|uniref:Enoyl-CoA hydratase/carnithine racemase n=1 Tax=Saccharopolyspora spinosa TaxID=60894 RepID=A0A2N3Y3S5_SACSN|nr:enoyl-CoA hydratase/isomerase family protein [Saccharopolyspora spinosa]PKW17471.1 enoyl-CoA hydratase/carnithine racemase [Saccharopolyspora spinosa]
MSDGLVDVTVEGNVANVMLRDSARRNPLSDAMIDALTTALRTSEVHAASVVVLRGEGGFFSAGGDLAQFHASLTTDAMSEYEATESFRVLFQVLESVPGLVLAVVEGKALGGGCGLAAACDLVLAPHSAKFGCPEINIGAFPMVIVPPLVRAIGARATLALSATGTQIDATEARRLGLVTEVFVDDEFEDEVAEFVKRMGSRPRHALTLGKATVRSAQTSSYDEGLLMGSVMRALVFAQPSFHDGVSEFVARTR